MNGQWLSQTRKLNHHYQSAKKRVVRAYMYINNQYSFSGCPYYFTPQGLRIDFLRSSVRQFCRTDRIQITDQYLPIMIIPESEIYCAGVSFKTLDLENEPFTCDGLDVILRKETLTITSAFDGSKMTMTCIVVLINTSNITTYLDPAGILYYDTRPIVTTVGHGLRLLFTGIDKKLAVVGDVFDVKFKDVMYYHTQANSTNFNDYGNGYLTPKNLNNLKKGTVESAIRYRINPTAWATLPLSPQSDDYYNYKWYISGNQPYESVAPNFANDSVRGNYIIVPCGGRYICNYYGSNGTAYAQFRNAPTYLATRSGLNNSGLNVSPTEDPMNFSDTGKLFCTAYNPPLGWGQIASEIEGLDWTLDMTDGNGIFSGQVEMHCYGAPFVTGGSGSSMSLQYIVDQGMNNWNSTV